MKKPFLECEYTGLPDMVRVVSDGEVEWIEHAFCAGQKIQRNEYYRGVLKGFCDLRGGSRASDVKNFVEKYGALGSGEQREGYEVIPAMYYPHFPDLQGGYSQNYACHIYREQVYTYRKYATEFSAMRRIMSAIRQGKNETPIEEWLALSRLRCPDFKEGRLYELSEVAPSYTEELSQKAETAIFALNAVLNQYIGQAGMHPIVETNGRNFYLTMDWKPKYVFPLLVHKLSQSLIAKSDVFCTECGAEYDDSLLRKPQIRRNWYCSYCKPDATRQVNTERKRKQREREAIE